MLPGLFELLILGILFFGVVALAAIVYVIVRLVLRNGRSDSDRENPDGGRS